MPGTWSRIMWQSTLPDKRRVFCVNPFEVSTVHGQIARYFRHGISLADGDIVFDVGANIGLFTLAACDWGKRRLTVLAFEPMPALFEALQANVARYRLAEVLPLPWAVSKQRGQIDFTYYPLMTVWSTAFPDYVHSPAMRRAVRETVPQFPPAFRWLGRLPASIQTLVLTPILNILFSGRRVTCPTVSLSDIIRERGLERVDLIKIDAEQAELDILHGLAAEDWPRIKQIALEAHDTEQDGERLKAVVGLLARRGFDRIIAEEDPDTITFGFYNVYAFRST